MQHDSHITPLLIEGQTRLADVVLTIHLPLLSYHDISPAEVFAALGSELLGRRPATAVSIHQVHRFVWLHSSDLSRDVNTALSV